MTVKMTFNARLTFCTLSMAVIVSTPLYLHAEEKYPPKTSFNLEDNYEEVLRGFSETTTVAETSNVWYLSDVVEYEEKTTKKLPGFEQKPFAQKPSQPVYYAATSYWEQTEIETPTAKKVEIDAESIVEINGRRYYVYRQAQYTFEDGTLTNVLRVLPVPENFEQLPSVPKFSLSRNVNISVEKGVVPLSSSPEQPSTATTYEYVDYLAEEDIEVAETPGPLLSEVIGIGDPIEGFNRSMFAVDGFVFNYFFSPLGKAYRFVIPLYVRSGIKRMDDNIMMPKRFVNCLLQAKFTGAGVEISRFLVNTTVGLVGFYDPAEAWMDLHAYDEDTGQTFAVWGIGPGFYLYLPIVGPTTARDGVGLIFDEAMDPRTYAPFGGYAKAFMKFNNMTLIIDDFEKLQDENLDPYTVLRDMWYLTRTAKIAE